MIRSKTKLPTTCLPELVSPVLISTSEQFTIHYDWIFNIAFSYVHEVHDAEDIAQEVYVVLLKKSHTFKGLSSLKTWIYRITVNTALNYIQKKRLQTSKKYENYVFYEQPTYSNSPEILFITRDLSKNTYVIKKYISLLPKTQRRALRMYLYLKRKDTFSQKKIAVHLGISIKALESLIQRAKKNLKKHYTCFSEGN